MKRSRSIRLGAIAAALGCLPPLGAQTAEDYFQRGFEKEQKRDFDGALADFNRALALDPDYAEALNGRGFVKHVTGDIAGALADYDLAIAADPRHLMAYNNRGNIRRDQGDFAGAIADFDRAIAIKPDYANAFVNRGGAYAAQGRFDRAIADYDRAIAIKPDHAIAFNNRANAKAAQRDLAAAIADFDRSLQLDATNAQTFGSRASARNAQGDFAAAIEDYSTAIRLARDDAARAWCYRCLTLRRLHRDDLATELSATKVIWKDAWSKSMAGYLLGEVAEAAFFAEAEARNHMGEADYFAGMMHLLHDEPADARRFFSICIALARPGDTSGGLARAELERLPRMP